MSDAERIVALERRVADLERNMQTIIDVVQNTGGTSRVFENAMLAVITAFPGPKRLEIPLRYHIGRVEASIVGESLSESHVDGSQSARDVLLAHLEDALARDSASSS